MNICRQLMYLSNSKVIPAHGGGEGVTAISWIFCHEFWVPGVTWPSSGSWEGGGGARGHVTHMMGSAHQVCDMIPGTCPRGHLGGRHGRGARLCIRRGDTGSPLWVENREVLKHASREFLPCCANGRDHNSLFHAPLKGSSKSSWREGRVGKGWGVGRQGKGGRKWNITT